MSRGKPRYLYGIRQRVHFCIVCRYHLVMKKKQKCEPCKKKEGNNANG